MKEKFINLYMDWASRAAELSHAIRRQVGAVIVKDDSVISYGYNGMPAGWDNNCEDKIYCLSKDFNGNYFPGTDEEYPFEDELGKYKLKTKPEVLHAESNAIAKLARSSQSGLNAGIFVTTAPCLDCAKLIYQSGITSVYYRDSYRDMAGVDFLEKSGIEIKKVD